MPLPRGVIRSMFLRSFAIQGSWNYRTLQGSGFAYALIPVLRHVYGDDGDAFQQAVERHTSLFNAHPYLAGVALGAVARMEADGEDPALIERFKTALRGSLGTLGDRLVWAGWRPACVLLGLFVLLLTHSAAVSMVVFLLIYNTGHLSLRWWGLRIGIEQGRNVGETLRRSPLMQWHDRVVSCAAFLIGAVMPLIAAGALTGSSVRTAWLALPAVAAVIGWKLAGTIRLPVLVLLAIVTIAGFLHRLVQ